MKKYKWGGLSFIAIVGILANNVIAGLPPTSSKGSNDAGPVTTFNTILPWTTVSHFGVTATINSPTTLSLTTLGVSGAATISGTTLSGSGNVNTGGTLSGSSSSTTGSIYAGGSVSAVNLVSSGTITGSALGITGASTISGTTLSGTGNINTAGTISGGALNIAGGTTLTGAASLTGGAYINSPLVLNGSTISGGLSFPTIGSTFGGNTNSGPLTGLNVVALGNSVGLVMTSAANNVAIGENSGSKITTSSLDVLIGTSVGAGLTTAGSETAVGHKALSADTAGGNTAVGAFACGANTTGVDNTCIGTNAAATNTGGTDNTVVGNLALRDMNNGSYNVAVGSFSLEHDTAGSRNVAIGYNSLSGNVGGNASSNVAIGTQSLGGLNGTNAQQNVAVGDGAGNAGTPLTTGSSNTFLGFNSQTSNATLSNAMALGASASVAVSNAISIGTTTNNTTIPGTLTVTGMSTLTGGATITGALFGGGGTTLSGNTKAAAFTASGLTNLNGNTTIAGTWLSDTAATTISGILQASGGNSLSGGTSISGGLMSSGGTTISGSTTTSGAVYIGGTTALGGNLFAPASTISGLLLTQTESTPTQGYNNFILNAGFNDPTYNQSWSTSGSGVLSKDTTHFHSGTTSALMTTTANTGCVFQDFTPTTETASTNLEYSAWVKTGSTVADVQVCARNQGATVGNCTKVPATSAWQYVPVNYPGVTLGNSVGLSVCNTTNTTETFNVDDAYVGSARNISQVAQAQEIGQVKISACNIPWAYSATSFGSAGANTLCTYTVSGNAVAPLTQLPAIRFNSLSAGNYEIDYQGSLQQTASGKAAYFQFSDGTNTANETSVIYNNNAGAGGTIQPGIHQTITYLTAPNGAVQLELLAKVDSGGTASVYGTTAQPGVITVKYYPLTSQQAVNSNQVSAIAFANNTAGGSYTSGAVFPFTNVIIDNMGGFSAGTYTVKQPGYMEGSVGIYNNATNITPIQLKKNGVALQNSYYPASTTGTNIIPPVDFAVAIGDTVTVTASGSFTLDAAAPVEYWISLKQIQTQQNAPILINGINSSGTGTYHAESAFITDTGTCTITSQTGSWIASISTPGTGECNLTFAAGEFSAAPACVLTPENGPTSIMSANIPTTTSLLQTIADASGSATNTSFYVMCMGPR